MTVPEFNKLVKTAVLNTSYFIYEALHLKGCRNCDKIVKHNHTDNPRFQKEGRYVYICECSECDTPMLLDSVDFHLLHNKV